MRVPGRVDRYIGTNTSCNKGVGVMLRPLHMTAQGLSGSSTDYGHVTIPRFSLLNGKAISEAPKKWNREVSPARAKRVIEQCAKHLTDTTTGIAHEGIVQCLRNGLAIDLYKTNRKVRHSHRN